MKIELENTTWYTIDEKVPTFEDWLVSGKTNRQLVILLSTADDTCNNDQKILISKLIEAVRYSPEEVPVYLVPEAQGVPFHQVKKQLRPARIIAFGILPERMHLNVEVGTNESIFFGGTQILFAPEVEKLMKDKHRKEALWRVLQEMFNLK